MPIDPKEVQASVEKIIPQKVRSQYDPLGGRRIETSYGDYRDAALGVLLSKEAALFYIVRLARDRLLRDIDLLLSTTNSLIEAAALTTRHVLPITGTSNLTNAQIALDQLALAMSERTGVFQQIAQVPAFQRFEKNADRFLAEDGKNARHRGSLTDTPQLAKAKLRPLAMELRTAWDALLQKAKTWVDSIPNFLALNLPSSFSKTILKNASLLLKSRVEELDKLTPQDRLKIIRSVVVDLLAVKATVKGYGQVDIPTTFLLLTGEGGAYADASHPLTPARLVAGYFGGYAVYAEKDVLYLLLDGIHSIALHPPGSFVARHSFFGSRGPFTIDPAACEIRVAVESNQGSWTAIALSSLSLPTGSVQPWQIAAAVNDPFVYCELCFISPKTIQEIDITPSASYTFTLTGVSTWADLGVGVDDRVIINDSTSGGYNSVWSVVSTAQKDATVVLIGGSAPSAEVQKRVQVGADADIRFFIQIKDAAAALQYRQTLRLTDAPGNTGTLTSLSFFSGATIETIRTSTETLARYINQSTESATLDNVPRVSAEAEFIPNFFVGQGRTNPNEPFLVSFFRVREEAEVVSGVSPSILKSAKVAEASVIGDVLVVRAGSSTNDVNKYGTVLSVFGDTVTVAMSLSGAGSVLVEVGPDYHVLSNMKKDVEVRINGQQLFDGTYPAASTPPPTPLDIPLGKAMVGNAGFGGQPILFSGLEVGQHRLVLHSLETSLSSSLCVQGSGTFDSSLAATFPTVYGTTRWVRLPSAPRRLRAGDVFELYVEDTRTPYFTSPIQSVDRANKLIELEIPLSAQYTSFVFIGAEPIAPNAYQKSELPFARIRTRLRQNFNTAAEKVINWLELPVNTTTPTFRTIDYLLTPLLAETRPAMSAVGQVRTQLGILAACLSDLKSYLAEYDADIVEEVDSLVRGYTQRGMERAVDVLLTGNFVTFFGLDNEGASYVGNFQKALREVEREDLPVRKDNRVNAADAPEEQTIAQWDDTDFDYTQDQTDRVPDIGETNSPDLDLPL